MSGVKGKSGRRFQSYKTIDKLCSFADTLTLRAIKDESIPLIERGRLASQFSLKKLAEKSESVVVNLNLSDELMRRIMQRLQMNEVSELPPPDIYITPEPNDLDSYHAPSPTDPPSTPAC